MKLKRTQLFSILFCHSVLLAAPPLHAVNLFWDTDGVTLGAGGGTAPTGTWSAGGTTWSTDLSGLDATIMRTTTSLDDLFFSAGTTASGSYAVTVSGTQNARRLTFEEGAAALSGGTLVLGGNGGITVAAGSGNPSISSDITFNGLSQQTGLSDASLSPLTISINGTVVAVPEPRAALLGGLGLLMLLRRRR